jgi:hypothetical protein
MPDRRPDLRLTRLQKRLLVHGRLVQPDAAQMSDRAVARELGVSQPFVSDLRRQGGRRRRQSDSTTFKLPGVSVTPSEIATFAVDLQQPMGRIGATTDAHHSTPIDQPRPLAQWVRYSVRPNSDVGHALHDRDPFE